MEEILIWVLSASLWAALTFLVLHILKNSQIKKAEDKASIILKEAENKSSKLLEDTRKESFEIIKRTEKAETRVLEKEEKLDRKIENVENRQDNLVKKEEAINKQKEELEKKKIELDWTLEEMSKLTVEEARELFLKDISIKFEKDWKDLIVKHKQQIEDNKKEEAREIILKAIHKRSYNDTYTNSKWWFEMKTYR